MNPKVPSSLSSRTAFRNPAIADRVATTNTLFAGMFGFEKKGYFKADAGSEKAPEVDFGK